MLETTVLKHFPQNDCEAKYLCFLCVCPPVFRLLLLFLPDLSARVDAVKEENLKLKSENQVLGQYIENLMSASSVFQATDTKAKRK